MAEAPSHQYPTAPLALPARPRRPEGARSASSWCTGSPARRRSMKPWAQALADQGYAVEVPLLPGHGTRWQDLNQVSWTDWYDEAEAAFDRLRESCEAVVVAGLSMGGSVVLRLAEERGDQVSGIVLVNPFVSSIRNELHALPVLKYVVPSLRGVVNDIKKPDQDEHGYDRLPLKGLAEVTAHVEGRGPGPEAGDPAAALLPVGRRPRDRRVVVRHDPARRRLGRRRGADRSTTATTSPRSTTTPSGSSPSPPSSSPG